MKRYVCALVALGISLAFAVPAQASALDLLSTGLNLLEDDDFEAFFDRNVDDEGNVTFTRGSLASASIGDVVVGIIEISGVNGTGIGAGESTFTGILVSRIAAVGGPILFGAGAVSLTFEAVSAADYLALQAALPALPGRLSDDSAVLVYDGVRSVFDISTVNAGLASAQSGPLLVEFGFVTSPGDAAAFSIAEFSPFGSFFFEGGLNLTANPAGLIIVKDNFLSDGVGSPAAGTEYRFPANQGTGNAYDMQFVGQPGAVASVGAFDIATDTDIFINVVPEPGSMTLLAMGGLGLLGAGYRRRKAAKAMVA